MGIDARLGDCLVIEFTCNIRPPVVEIKYIYRGMADDCWYQ